MKGHGFLTIEYNGKQSGYKAIVLEYTDRQGVKVIKRFETGDPIVDHIDYLLFAGSDDAAHNIHMIMKSSSVDDFMCDGNRFKSMYVKTIDLGNEQYDFKTVSAKKVNSDSFDSRKYTRYITRHPYTEFVDLRAYYYKQKAKAKKAAERKIDNGITHSPSTDHV